MPDQIIDAMMALSLHDDASRVHPLAAWVVMEDQPGYAGHLIARLVTNRRASGSLGHLGASWPDGR
jgi:hypothetical protein